MKKQFTIIGGRIFPALLCIALCQCTDRSKELFRTLDADRTGIHFSNQLAYTDSLTVLDFEYMYNGAGVAVGDVNNDGFQDIYFTGNMTSGKLYLNRGNRGSAPWQFEDITAQAKVGTKTWANGVAMVDINQDGFKDIYVCVGGNRNTPEKDKVNLLFINNGNQPGGEPTFTESAAQYGLADTGYSIQSAFFDYDGDGDLDMYLLRNAYVDYDRNTIRPKRVTDNAASTGKLFRNDTGRRSVPLQSPLDKGGNRRSEVSGVFTDVSAQAGLRIEGFGLGVEICDINNDDWPDIYVSNDFITNDLLWINNRDGTFTNQAGHYLKHQTYNGMGNDVADFNNDGLADIVVLDMLPEENRRWKLTSMGNNYDEFRRTLVNGYEPQYVRNTLQLNQGTLPRENGKAGRSGVSGVAFSEIGRLAGIKATEWSWAPLFADYDNDGWKDLFITNGFRQDITNLDFVVYGNRVLKTGTPEAKKKERMARLKELPGIKTHNYVYKNRRDLTFEDKSAAWGMSEPTYSNGAAYADLDNDGDLDLVVNNIDAEATIQENRSNEFGREGQAANYLRVKFNGPLLNREGLGAKVHLKHQGTLQYQYFTPFRGYLSSVEPILHFGLGRLRQVDSVEVRWPDGRYQLLTGVKANQVLQVDYANATQTPAIDPNPSPLLFSEVTRTCGISYQHRENDFVDFKVQPLLPHLHSRNGPGITVGDVNGDGLDDFYAGGATGYAGALFLQQADGHFLRQSTPGIDSLSEELGVLFFDADNDRDEDLYIATGGSEQLDGSVRYQDHFYLNDGKGRFSPVADALPDLRQSGSSVAAADYDHDGDLDLLVAGRLVPGRYPMPASSFLLRNDSQAGHCRFTDVTGQVCPSLLKAGLVSSALWSDYDRDGWPDLVLAGEWMPLTFYHNQRGKLVDATRQTGLTNTTGWWNSLAGGDFDADGDVDYLAGNLGLNSRYRASPTEPLCIHTKDYNQDGLTDPVMSYAQRGNRYLLHTRDDLTDQIREMRGRFPTYQQYADATFERSFRPDELSGAYVVCAQRMESSYVENLGGGRFSIRALPTEAQLAPVYGMATGDYNGDGRLDALLVGNSYAPEVASGRDDASLGVYLQGDGQGNFQALKARESGFVADQDGKGMAGLVLGDGAELLLVGNNDGALRAYATRQAGRVYRAGPGDVYAEVRLKGGQRYRQEFYYGSTYLSQSARVLRYPDGAASITIYDSQGMKKIIQPDLHVQRE